MFFKIEEEQLKNLITFINDNLLTKHGAPILQFLNSLPKAEEQIVQPPVETKEDHT